jgi:hypothetical protein
MKRLRVCLILTLAMLLVTGSVAGAGGDANHGVFPPAARVYGLTLGEWSASWWQALLSIPAAENPAMGAPWTDCFLQHIGNVGLGIGFFAESGTFACEMPSGTILLQSVVATECSTLEEPPYYGGTPQELRACARSSIPTNVQVTIDGVALKDPSRYLVTSPLYFFTVPEDNVLGVPAGSGWSVSHGAFFMLAPLSPGQHTMHLHGEWPDFVYDWNYDITVTP